VGTAITLEVGGIELTYTKNDRGIDHGSLFQEHDRKPVHSDQIDYDHFKTEHEDLTPMEMAFVRPLNEVVPRLELLGFSLERVRREYDAVAEHWREEMLSGLPDDADCSASLMSFVEFLDFVKFYPIASLDRTYVENDSERIKSRFLEFDTDRIPGYLEHANHAYSERSYFSGLIDILHPYSTMRLLAESKDNENALVVWQYGPLVDAGWATEQEFLPNARRGETFLIATEGSSDVHVLKKALELLRPGVADFFRFIDVTESHPFSGTGNLVKFAEGLAKIDVQNMVLFLFDNDAEGLEACLRISKLTLPANMRGAILPELKTFESFPARGPEGISLTNINRRAAAIECYLDLRIQGQPPATILWTNFKKSLGVYQGSLEYKESYTKDFLKQDSTSLANGSYDATKLGAVLDLLQFECTGIAFDQWALTAPVKLDGKTV
jgi:HEPN/Toprim N-terminal domain 1